MESTPKHYSNTGDFNGSIRASGDASHSEMIVFGSRQADNILRSGILSEVRMDYSTGLAGANFAVYGVAIGEGYCGNWGVHDVVGVHGTAYKKGNQWAAGVHADVYDTGKGGTAIGVNVEFPQTVNENPTIGMNIQPHDKAKNITGIQFQNEGEGARYGVGIDMWQTRTDKAAIRIGGSQNIIFGSVDGCPFGMRFNQHNQCLEFYRSIGKPDEVRVGFINMQFGAPDVAVNQ